MKYQLITIEGNIGAGKTTLSKLLAEHYNAQLILEQFEDNPFLPKFYKDADRYAFPLELTFLAERYKQLKKQLTNRDIFQPVTVSDYLFIKSKLFAKVNLPQDEYELYETLFDIIYPNLPQPEVLIFLQAPISKLQENISSRNRDYEQDIENDYLQKIQDAYSAFLKSQPFITLMIDTTKTDFLNNKKHFETLVNYLEADYEKGTHWLEFE